MIRKKSLRCLYEIKKQSIFATGNYELEVENDTVIGSYKQKGEMLVGIFQLQGKEGEVHLPIQDGIYTNMIDHQRIEVKAGVLRSSGEPIILAVEA